MMSWFHETCLQVHLKVWSLESDILWSPLKLSQRMFNFINATGWFPRIWKNLDFRTTPFFVWEVDIEIRAPQPNTPSPYKELNLKRTNQLKSINTWRCQHWNALDSCAIAIHCHYHSQHTAMKIPLNTSSAAHNSSHSGHPDRLQDLYPKNAWVNPCFRINEMAMFSPISPMSYKASNLRWPTSYRIIAVIKCHGYLPLPSLEW